MRNSEQQNGNPHTNETRNTFNDKVGKLSFMGQAKKVIWRASRRWRDI